MEPALKLDSHIMSLSYFDMFTKKFATYTYTSYMCTYFSYLAGMSPYISLKIKKRHYEHHIIEAHK